MWTSVTGSTVDASRRAATPTDRTLAAVKPASFWRPTARSATVSEQLVNSSLCFNFSEASRVGLNELN